MVVLPALSKSLLLPVVPVSDECGEVDFDTLECTWEIPMEVLPLLV